MKTTIPFVALAMVGLSLSPIHAADATATKSATEMVAGDKIPVYVVVVSGKG